MFNKNDITIEEQDIKPKSKKETTISVGGWAFRIIITVFCLAAIAGVVIYALNGNTKPGKGLPEVPVAK